MEEQEIYNLITKDVFKYPLLNEIFAIRDNTKKINDEIKGKVIYVNGTIALDVISENIEQAKERILEHNSRIYNEAKLIDYAIKDIQSDKIIEILAKKLETKETDYTEIINSAYLELEKDQKFKESKKKAKEETDKLFKGIIL